MKEQTRTILARNVTHLGLGQVASTALGLLLTAILGRAFAPEQFGTLYIVLTIAGFVQIVVDWGQSTYLVREVARVRHDEPQLIASALLFRIATTSCASLLAGVIARAMQFSDTIVILSMVSTLTGLPFSIYAPFGFVFRGRDKMGVDVFVSLVGKIVTLLATALALYFGGSLTEVIVMQGVGGFASLIAAGWLIKRSQVQVGVPSSPIMQELFWRGMPLTATALVTSIQPLVETLLLSAFAGAAVVGWYSASRAITGLALSPATITVAGFFPELSRAVRSPPELKRMMTVSTRVLGIAAAAVCSGLYVFAEHGVAIIYGHGRFEETVPILRMTAVFIPLWYVAYLLASTMAALGRNNEMLGICIIRVAACAFMGWLFIGYWQQTHGNGAVILVAISGAAEIPAVIACLLFLPWGTFGWGALSQVIRCGIASACTILVASHFEPVMLAVLIPLYTSVFLASAFATGLVLPSDLRLGMEILRKGRAAISAGGG